MFHLKHRLPFALAIAALTVLTVTLWTGDDGEGAGNERAASRWGGSSATDPRRRRRGLTTTLTSLLPSSWTGAAHDSSENATPSVDDAEEEDGVEEGGEAVDDEDDDVDEEVVDYEGEGGKSELTFADDDLVAPFLRHHEGHHITGVDEDDTALDVVGGDVVEVDDEEESRELQSICGQQCRGDYQCRSGQAAFKCLKYNANFEGICCEPGGGGCAACTFTDTVGDGGDRFNRGCGSVCRRDAECNQGGCFACIGGFCRDAGGNRNVCGGPCNLGGLRCPVGCRCNGSRCVFDGGNRNDVCNQSCLNRNSFNSVECYPPCDFCSASGFCVSSGGGNRNVCDRNCVNRNSFNSAQCAPPCDFCNNNGRCVSSGNRNNVCGIACGNRNSFNSPQCYGQCNFCNANGRCADSGNRNNVCGITCGNRNSFNSPQCYGQCNFCSAAGRCVDSGNRNTGLRGCGQSCSVDGQCGLGGCNFCDYNQGFSGQGICRNVNTGLRTCGDACSNDGQCGRNGCNFCIGGVCGGDRFGPVNPVLRGCNEVCSSDSQCGLNGCNFCIGGRCGGNRFGTGGGGGQCSGNCIGNNDSMCPFGCSCIAGQCR